MMPAHHLPVQMTPFVGRDAELAEIERLLSNPACRLLTLVGPGGIGKTRLALEAARHVTSPDGVHFVAFQPLTSPDFMVSTIADAVNFHFYAGAEPKQQLLDYLREKSSLLVLDNLEHLLDGVILLSEILDAAPAVRILATSRERLNLREEWVLEVGGLSYPISEKPIDIEAYSAVELFSQHARRASVSFHATDDQKPFVIKICRLVGGMPLGIELAASWVRALSCQQIADEIERSLDILETSARNVESRHRTMRAAFEPTWERMSKAERNVFMKLSVFRGGFTREAAEQVANASLRTLTALVDKSLLRVDEHGRYDLHELLWQYAQEKLAEVPAEQKQAQDQHCTYYANFMGHWAEDPMGITSTEARESILGEMDNVRLAFRRAADTHKLNELGAFLHTLPHFYDVQDRYHEGVELCGMAFASLRSAFDETNEQQTRLLGLALAWQAWFLKYLLRTDEAQQLVQDSFDLLMPLGYGHELVYTYMFRRFLTWDWMEAKQFSQAALTCAEALDFDYGIIMASGNLSQCSFALREYDESRRFAHNMLTLCRKHSHQYGESWALQAMSFAAFGQENYVEAKQWLQEALVIAEAIGFQYGIVMMRQGLSDIAYAQREYAEARRCYQETFVLAQELGNPQCMGWVRNALARAEARLGNVREARQHLRALLEVAHARGEVELMRETFSGAAIVKVAEGDVWRAVECVFHLFQRYNYNGGYQLEDERLRRELEASLTPEVYKAAWERGMKSEVTALAAELLAEFSQPVESPRLVVTPNYHLVGVDSLSERELTILRLMAEGLNSREIADRLYLSVKTIRWYLKGVYSKLDVHSRSQAIARAKKLQLLI